MESTKARCLGVPSDQADQVLPRYLALASRSTSASSSCQPWLRRVDDQHRITRLGRGGDGALVVGDRGSGQLQHVEREAVGVLGGTAALGVDHRDGATEAGGDAQGRHGLASAAGAEQCSAQLGGGLRGGAEGGGLGHGGFSCDWNLMGARQPLSQAAKRHCSQGGSRERRGSSRAGTGSAFGKLRRYGKSALLGGMQNPPL